MEKKEQIEAFCRQFKITGMVNSLSETVSTAEKQNLGYMDFLYQLFSEESAHRIRNEVIRRQKTAGLPLKCDLGQFDSTVENGLSLTRINHLR